MKRLILRKLRVFLFLVMAFGVANSQVYAFNNVLNNTAIDMGQGSGYGFLSTMGIALPALGLGYFGLKCCCNRFREAYSGDELWLMSREKRVKLEKKNFEQWRDLCKSLPRYSQASEKPDSLYGHTVLSKEEFIYAIADLLAIMGKGSLAEDNNWVDQVGCFCAKDFKLGISGRENYGYATPDKKFFVQKLDLPSGAKIKIHADIHGDIHSLNVFLGDLYDNKMLGNDFEIKDKDLYLAFLGDYTDRGIFGAEVIYTLARLKAANPERVILLRGNHESINMNLYYGFIEVSADKYKIPKKGELLSKFALNERYIKYLLAKLYNLMPSAVFVGCQKNENALSGEKGVALNSGTDAHVKDSEKESDYALLCHGGLERCFDVSKLFKKSGQCVYCFVDEYKQQGLLWNDFTCKKDEKNCGSDGRIKYSYSSTIDYFKKMNSKSNFCKVKVKFGGHQHNGDMLKKLFDNGGIHNVWADKQWTGWNSKNPKKESLKIDPDYPVWILCTSLDNDEITKEEEEVICDFHVTLNVFSENVQNWFIEPKRIKVF